MDISGDLFGTISCLNADLGMSLSYGNSASLATPAGLSAGLRDDWTGGEG